MNNAANPIPMAQAVKFKAHQNKMLIKLYRHYKLRGTNGAGSHEAYRPRHPLFRLLAPDSGPKFWLPQILSNTVFTCPVAHMTHLTHLTHGYDPGPSRDPLVTHVWPRIDPIETRLTHVAPTKTGWHWFLTFLLHFTSSSWHLLHIKYSLNSLDTQFWLCSPHNFMKCLLYTPISLHISTSLHNLYLVILLQFRCLHIIRTKYTK